MCGEGLCGWGVIWTGRAEAGAGGSGSLCPAINRCHVTVQSARGRAEQPAGYQGRSLLGAEAASRISDQ